MSRRILDWGQFLVLRHGPASLSAILGGLLLAELIRLSMTFWDGEPPGAPARPTPAIRVRAEHFQALIDAHLFGAYASESHDDRVPTASSVRLTLAGTLASENPRLGMAIISDEHGTKVYSVGNSVAGAVLHSVFVDRALLDRNGRLEFLLMPNALAGGRASQDRPAIDVKSTDSAATQTAEANAMTAQRAMNQFPALLADLIRVVPAPNTDNDGKLLGYRTYPGVNVQAFSQIGLRPADLLIAINGISLDDPRRSQELFNKPSAGGTMNLTIQRNGQRVDVAFSPSEMLARSGDTKP